MINPRSKTVRSEPKVTPSNPEEVADRKEVYLLSVADRCLVDEMAKRLARVLLSTPPKPRK